MFRLDGFDTRLSNFRIELKEPKEEGEIRDEVEGRRKSPRNSINRALSNVLDEVEKRFCLLYPSKYSY